MAPTAVVEHPSFGTEVEFDRPWVEEVLPLHDLRIDRRYQRDLQTAEINKIAAAYDLALAGYIVVSRRLNGYLYVIDGQQRVAGARNAGEEEILARVFDDLDIRTEAQYFDLLNNTQPQTAHGRFKAAYAAGDPDVHNIYNIVHSFGASIYDLDGKGAEAIQAVAALRWIFGQGHVHGLTNTLAIIRRAFDEVSRTTTQTGFLKAVYYALDRHDAIDQARLAKRIQDTGMIGLKQRAIAFTARSADATGYYWALLDAYNHKLGEQKRLNPVFKRNVANEEARAGLETVEVTS